MTHIPQAKKPIGPIVPPQGATHWGLFRQSIAKNPSGSHGRSERCYGEPQPDGHVPESWPVSDFSVPNILASFGSGKYRVEWYDAQSEHLTGRGRTFVVAEPKDPRADARLPRARSRARASRAVEDDAPELEGVPVGRDGRMGLLDVVQLMQARDERADRRAEAMLERQRQDAETARQRDRDFMTLLMQQSGAGAGGGARSQAIDIDQLSRTMQLQIREQMLVLREDLGVQRQAEREAAGTEPEGDAGDRLLGVVVDELEEQVPDLLRKHLPDLVEFLKQKGYRPSATVQGVVNHVSRARGANGA